MSIPRKLTLADKVRESGWHEYCVKGVFEVIKENYPSIAHACKYRTSRKGKEELRRVLLQLLMDIRTDICDFD